MRDRGAAIVEFALISFALFFLLFFIIEGAFAVRARTTVSNALDDAARRAAIAGDAPDADYQILFQLFGRNVAGVAEVERVVIFKADSGNAPVPPGCLNGVPQSDVCNVYTAAQLFDANGAFNDNPSLYACPRAWCSTDRGKNTDGSLEFIGVHVEADYRTIISGIEGAFFPEALSVNVSGHALQAIETIEIVTATGP